LKSQICCFSRVRQLILRWVETVGRWEGSNSCIKLARSSAVTVSLVDSAKIGSMVKAVELMLITYIYSSSDSDISRTPTSKQR
jgi:hypothetical protein